MSIDGTIVLQFMALKHSFRRTNNFRALAGLFCAIDIGTLVVVYLMGELTSTVFIIGVSLVGAGVSMMIGMMVEFSVSTWFSYIR